MARPAVGSVVERAGKRGTVYALRFRAYGKRRYETLDRNKVTTRAQAEVALAYVLADVDRGIWRPAEPPPDLRPEPTFHEFATEWVAAREQEGLAAKSVVDLRWSLSHLLGYFASKRLSEITPQEVDRYKVAKTTERKRIEEARARGEKMRERGLSNNSINHTLSDLAQVLETAVEYGLIGSNPASGKRRRLKSTRPARPWVEPEQLMALLDAARSEGGDVGRILAAILAGAGLRIGEALDLRWRHVDLAVGTLHVIGSKTAAGIRAVDLTPALREELTVWKATSRHNPLDDYVVATGTGRKHNPSNLRRDVLHPAIAKANEQLTKDGIAEIDPVTFHSLRRTFASLRCACGDDLRYTSTQLGHEDVRFTMVTYAKATRRRERLSGPHLRAYDRALEWAQMGTSETLEHVPATAEATKSPV